MSKLVGYDFSVEYQPTRLNTVVDVLSRRDSDDADLLYAVSSPRLTFFYELRTAAEADPAIIALRNEVLARQ